MNKVLVETTLDAIDINHIIAKGACAHQLGEVKCVTDVTDKSEPVLDSNKTEQDMKSKTLILCHLITSNPQVEVTAHQITSLTKKLYKGLEE